MSASDGQCDLSSELLRQRILLYLYGELGLHERQQVERLRREDPTFSALFDQEEAFLLAIGDPAADTDAEAILGDCREDLALAIGGERVRAPGRSVLARGVQRLRDLAAEVAARPLVWQPAAAAALLVVGFLAGRGSWTTVAVTELSSAPLAPISAQPLSGRAVVAGVETVHLDPSRGQVQIVLEERRVITGDAEDPMIRAMLMDSAQQSHAGARLASLEALQRHAADGDVRRILLRAMLKDQNVGVRLRALDAVRAHAGEPDVRDALVQMLRTEDLPGMRIHAIQILGEHPGRDLAGALQELVEREDNPFVVQESERILDVLDASMERF